MKNDKLIVKEEVSFNIILGAPGEQPGNPNGRDPFNNENLTNPRQWVHMDAKVHENTILVLGYFSGKMEATGDYTIEKASFSVLSVNAGIESHSTKFYDIYPKSFKYNPIHEKEFEIGGIPKKVTMKRICFEFDDKQSSSKKSYCEYVDMSPFTVKNGELIDFHIEPRSEKKQNLAPDKIVTVNGHICQGKFYIHP